MIRRLAGILIMLGLAAFVAVSGSAGSKGSFDILITGAKIVDGTGNPWFYGDIGIKGDTIAEIGNLRRRPAKTTLDAAGLVVAPGFIDMHTHCDFTIGSPEAKANLNYLAQGVTTVVTGNCGQGTFEIAKTKAQWEKQGIGTNAALLIGFGTVRKAVLKVEPRDPTPAELEKMKEILRQGMKEGAWGMSSGLEYIPDRYSKTEEVIALTQVVGEFGGIYSSHMRDEAAVVCDAVKETVRIAQEAGVRANIAHFKVCGKNNWGLMKQAIALVREARARGVYLVADQYPYTKSAPFGPIWQIPVIPDDLKPLAEIRKKAEELYYKAGAEAEMKKIGEQYVAELLKALADKPSREKIKKLTLEGTPHDPSPVALWGWHNFTILLSKKHLELNDKNMVDLIAEKKRDGFEILADLIIEEPDIFYSGGAMSEDEVKEALKEDWVMVSSDGTSAALIGEGSEPATGHPREFGSQAKVLRKYVREDKVLTLENAVRKMTSLPASFLGLKDRGLLLEGAKADLVLFNPESVRDNATYTDSRKYATGVEYVLLNGKWGIEKGKFNGSLNGKVLLK
jgi:N-acyl-D-aspartate/D-glutamate deacylase